jgi:hypothetical protein
VLNCGRDSVLFVLGISQNSSIAWELAGVFQIITVIYWSWKELVSIPQPRLLRFLTMKWFRCDGNVFQVVSLFWCRNWYCLGFCQRSLQLGFELMPKDNPATLTRRLWSSVLCNAPKSPNCGVCVFNDSCAALQKKKVDQLPVNLRSWRCAIVTLIIWCFWREWKHLNSKENR